MPQLRTPLAATIATALGLLVAGPAQAAPGDLTQKAGAEGCISESGTAPCGDGAALVGPRSIAVSPDGASTYVASEAGGVAVFDRAPDGVLTQKPGTEGCVSEDGSGGACADGVALIRPFSAAVSPDGASVYVASIDSDAVAVFDRAPNGALTQKAGLDACISETGSGGTCADGAALTNPISVTVSPDGSSAYAASLNGGVNVFDRAPDGALTQKAGLDACISETGSGGACADGVGLVNPIAVTVSPDGASAYAVGVNSNAVAVFDRAPDGALTQKAGSAACISESGAAPCADGVAIGGSRSVVVSPDGANVYMNSAQSDAIAVLDRAPDGSLAQKPGSAACVSQDGSGGACADGVGLMGAMTVAVSADGDSAYVSSLISDAVAVFDRASDGALTQKAGAAACVSEDGSGGDCADAVGLDGAWAVAVSPDGGNLYAGSEIGGVVAVFDRGGPVSPTPNPGSSPASPSQPAPEPTQPAEAPGKPHLELVGKAGPESSRVRVGCGGRAACTIGLTGVRELKRKTGRPDGRTESKRSAGRGVGLAAGERRQVVVRYTKYLARTIERARAAGIAPKLRITAKQAGLGFRTIVIRVGS